MTLDGRFISVWQLVTGVALTAASSSDKGPTLAAPQPQPLCCCAKFSTNSKHLLLQTWSAGSLHPDVSTQSVAVASSIHEPDLFNLSFSFWQNLLTSTLLHECNQHLPTVDNGHVAGRARLTDDANLRPPTKHSLQFLSRSRSGRNASHSGHGTPGRDTTADAGRPGPREIFPLGMRLMDPSHMSNFQLNTLQRGLTYFISAVLCLIRSFFFLVGRS